MTESTGRKRRTSSKQRSLPPQIKKMAEANKEFLRILVYGRPGTGKTVLAGSGGPRTLILESDRGEASAVRAGSEAMKWQLNDWHDFEEALTYLKGEGSKEFDMVWLDSLSHFQERGLDHIMADLVAQPKNKHRRDYLPDKGDYGANMNRLSSRLRMFRDLPMHIGITCHAHREIYLEAEDQTLNMPMVQGKDMSEKVCGYVDVIGRMQLVRNPKTKKITSVLDCTPQEEWYTKDRYGVGRMVNPTVPKILKIVSTGPVQETSQQGENE